MTTNPKWTAVQHDPVVVEGRQAQWLGRYRLCFEVAAGGMATVYLARAKGVAGFDKPVAVKRIHPHLARDTAFVEMFLDEARLASQIDHPNTCTVFDFGEADGSYFMAMEYLVGEPLSRVLRAMSKTPPPDTVRRAAWVARIVAQAADGLHAAHELADASGKPLGVIHRDVSPQNLFVTYDGHVKVVDFGIAYARDRLQHTRTGQLKGKPSYMAPEQLEAKTVDRRADVWALGVVAWEALTGRRLFKRDSEAATMRAVLLDPIPAPSTYDEEIPPAMEAIVLRALERDPARRLPTAREFSQEMSRILVGHQISFTAAEVADEMNRLFPDGSRTKRSLVERAVEMTGPQHIPRKRSPTPRMKRRAARRRPLRFAFAAMAVAVVAFSAALGLGGPGTSRQDHDDGSPNTQAEDRLPAPATEPGLGGASPVNDRSDPVPSPLPSSIPAEGEESRHETEVARQGRATATKSQGASTMATRRRPARPGRVALTTPGGWATVYWNGRRVGETPGVIELPAGRQLLSIRPNDQPPYRRVPVRVTPGRVARVRVDLR